MREISKGSVKVGLLQNAGTTPDGTPLTEIGAVHEFGTLDGHIPQRSWLRSTFRRTDAARKQFTAELVKKVLKGSVSVERALGLLGAWAVARVQETIVQRLTEGPENQANAPSTIAAKGSSTPLVDTGQLKNAISFQVVRK